MSIKIGKKIVGFSVQTPEEKAKQAAASAPEAAAPAPTPEPVLSGAEVIHMHEKVERPDVLEGTTYKIKSPLFEHALYVTINDIVLNEGTAHESRRPFEIFINSKNMEHFQWAVALTRIMSAVFRKGGDVTFLVEELKAVFDPRGGYFKTGGVYMPSVVAELGYVVEDHLKRIGMIVSDELNAEQRAALAKKRAEYEERSKKNTEADAAVEEKPRAKLGEPVPVHPLPQAESEGSAFPPHATLCGKCHAKAVIVMDGCATCLNCGYSKCG